MPQATSLTTGQEIRKTWQGREFTVRVLGENRFEVLDPTGTRIQLCNSLTAAAHAVRGDDQSVNGWAFFGLRNPAQRERGPVSSGLVAKKVTGKCTHQGCYEPADCHHGFCKDHCHRHEIGSYNARKTPRSMALHAAVEVEVTYPNADAFRRGVGIDCHRDGSLGTYGAEYKVLAKSTDIAAEVAELVHEVWKRGARVNRTCGLHVHVDARQLSEQRKDEVLAWARRTQDTWYGLFPASRNGGLGEDGKHRGVHYACRMTPYNTDAHTAWFHLSPYNTFEVRLHGGTLNPFKVAGWVTALVHLQAKANEPGYAFPSTGDADADFWAVFAYCPAEGREYLATRKACGGVLRDAAFHHIEE